MFHVISPSLFIYIVNTPIEKENVANKENKELQDRKTINIELVSSK